MNLQRYVSPRRWRRFIESRIELVQRALADNALDQSLMKLGPLPIDFGNDVLVADGLWLNPAYFLRLRLFIEARARTHRFRLLGILRTRRDTRARRALERIGFSEFIYIEEDNEFPVASFMKQAEQLLSGLTSHAALLNIALPDEVPAYVWYDTVLRKTNHGQPPLEHPTWRESLADTLAYIAVYRRLLAQNDVAHVVLSHAWKSEWGALTWLALRAGVCVHNVTAFSEAIRIRRFRAPEDFDIPVEHLPHPQFERLPKTVKNELAALGHAELHRRQTGHTSDVNIRYAYSPDLRAKDRFEARLQLADRADRAIGVIYGHSWFDFPHLYGMANFADFVDWFEVTLARIKELDHVTWLLKPHPMETWYGGYRMSDLVGVLPAHIRVLPHKIDTLSVMLAADALVTVHGTAALEAATLGVPVIAADRSYYSGWGITHSAQTRAHYLALLGDVGRLSRPDDAARERAVACFVAAYGEPHDVAGALRIPCDSGGARLYEEVRELVTAEPEKLAREVDRIAAFLAQDDIDSFETWTFVRAAEQRAGLRQVA